MNDSKSQIKVLNELVSHNISEFDYFLPKELIAQDGLEKRDQSRLLVYSKENKEISHKIFENIIDYFDDGDVIVVNETKVNSWFLEGKKESQSKMAVTLTKRVDEKRFECFVLGRNPRKDGKIIFDNDFSCVIKKLGNYDFLVEFNKNPDKLIHDKGSLILPSYIKKKLRDQSRYQTVFANKKGSIAAPTAGLHFTKRLIKILEKKGIKYAKVCLNVGIGTFQTVNSKDYTKHIMHSEDYEIPKECANTINKRKGKLIVVGTTTLRALESSISPKGEIIPNKGSTSLFIYPGYDFKLKFDAMITNFHLPKTSLLLLVASIIGKTELLRCYDEAIKEKYRFYSLGDAMMITLF